MRLAILGATGGTGRLLVDQALERGHEVVAYVRRPEALTQRPGLAVVGGQLTDRPALRSALAGVDAVLCAIGPAGMGDLFGGHQMQRLLPPVTDAMAEAGVRRLVLLSAYGVGDTAASASPVLRLIFATVARSMYRDKAIAEERLATTDLDVTTIHPVKMSNGSARDDAVVRDAAAVTGISGMPRVSRATVAGAMLDAAENPATVGQRLVVSSAGTVR